MQPEKSLNAIYANATVPEMVQDSHSLRILLRGFCVNWIAGADEQAAATFLAPDYTAHVGGVTFTGLENYIPAVLGQLTSYPGLGLSVHEVMLSEEGIAMVFTEHGATTDGVVAAWRGVGLFLGDDAHLIENWTEEDYYARRRQLESTIPDAVPAPATAPWATPFVGANEAMRSLVLAWLESGLAESTSTVTLDDNLDNAALLDQDAITVNCILSSGSRVAFQANLSGTFLGGLGVDDTMIGARASMGIAGLVSVESDGSISGQVVRDRLGLRRTLKKATHS
jgi:hypothetical protein